MAVRKIIRMGHPNLRRPARAVLPQEIGSDEMHRIVSDMIDTLHDYGGIGLAAPQINESIRLAIVELPGGSSRYGELDPVPLTICINPEIKVLDKTPAGSWEGCLSVPGLRGFVMRPQFIRVNFLDLAGEKREMEAKGFVATVFQHEFDHLDGRLYVDLIDNRSNLMFEEEYLRYVLPQEKEPTSVSPQK